MTEMVFKRLESWVSLFWVPNNWIPGI